MLPRSNFPAQHFTIQNTLKFPICVIPALLSLTIIRAQQNGTTSEIVSPSQVTTIFNDSVRKEFKITYPIFRVYKYADKSGEFLCALTESDDSTSTGIDFSGHQSIDTFSRAIKAVNLKVENNKLIKVWEINDHIIKNDNGEKSIWFWTKYFNFSNYDDDGLVVPIIIYGTRASNDYDDCRIKFIIFYKGQKMAIRHQNGILDGERETQIDKAVFSLPRKLRDEIKAKMVFLEKLDKAIFTDYPVH
jgi:hypothetical protein